MLFWRYASAAIFLIFIASGLAALRDLTPDFVSTLVSNLLIGLAYYMLLKSLRSVYRYTNWRQVDAYILLLYCAAIILVNLFFNTYANRVIVVSIGIIAFSLHAGAATYLSKAHSKRLGALIFAGFTANAAASAARMLSMLPITEQMFSVTLWEPVFFLWSVAASFLFAVLQFLNGAHLINQENQKALQESQQQLEYETELKTKLAAANEEQQNLQKFLLHEFKRPLAALHATLQSQDEGTKSLESTQLQRLSGLTSQATAYLEGISLYQDTAELFTAPNWSSVSVDELVQDIFTKWGLRASIDAQLDGKKLNCDLLLIDIALGNLIENAAKFGGGMNGVSVNIGLTDEKLQIDIQDCGNGIPKPEWGKVWQKFYKIDSKASSALTGCGLGLEAVKQIAHTHHGDAYVVSTQPSVIRLELPLLQTESAKDDFL